MQLQAQISQELDVVAAVQCSYRSQQQLQGILACALYGTALQASMMGLSDITTTIISESWGRAGLSCGFCVQAGNSKAEAKEPQNGS